MSPGVSVRRLPAGALPRWLPPLPITHRRIGSSVHPGRLPSHDDLARAAERAGRRGVLLELATPLVCDEERLRAARLAEELAGRLPGSTLVINDLGLLLDARLLAGSLELAAGRVLHRQMKDPRIPEVDPRRLGPLPGAWRQGSAVRASWRRTMRRQGISRVEVDWPPHGLDPEAWRTVDLPMTLHLPWILVAAGRARAGAADEGATAWARLPGEALDAAVAWIGAGPDRVALAASGDHPPNNRPRPRPRPRTRSTPDHDDHEGMASPGLDAPGMAGGREKRGIYEDEDEYEYDKKPSSSDAAEGGPAVRPSLLAPCSDPGLVEALAGSGADALYCGVFDEGWMRRWGPAASPNRRGPGPGNLASVGELDDLCRRARDAGVAVDLALNSPLMTEAQERAVIRLAGTAVEELGVRGLIAGDPGLLETLARRHPGAEIVASTVLAARNASAVRLLAELGARRVILGRQVRLDEVAAIRAAVPDVGVEVLVMRDDCGFEEGACASAHALPGTGVFCLEQPGVVRPAGRLEGACGLCAVPALAGAGVGGLKVVGREANAVAKIRAVQAVRRVLDVLDAEGAQAARDEASRLRGDEQGCRAGTSCYFPEVRPL